MCIDLEQEAREYWWNGRSNWLKIKINSKIVGNKLNRKWWKISLVIDKPR